MSEQFKVGEVLVGQNHIFDIDRNGMECEVIGHLEMRNSAIPVLGITTTDLAYVVRWADGQEWNAGPHYLRRRRLPTSDSGERMFMQRIRDMADKAPQRVGAPA